MKRWLIAIAVLALFLVAIPAASAQSDDFDEFGPDRLVTTSYTNNNYTSSNQGNVDLGFWFKTYENPLNVLDDSDLTLSLQVRIDEAVGHTHYNIAKSSNVPLVTSTVIGGTCSAYYTFGPYDSQLPDNEEQFTSWERRYDKCQGIHRYSVDSSTTLTLPANSVWNLNAGTHSLDGGAVTKTISADRRMMTVSVRDPYPFPFQVFTPEEGDGGGGDSFPAESPPRCRWDVSGKKADKNMAEPPFHGWYENEVTTLCRVVANDPILAKCVATIEAPEEPDPFNRKDRDEQVKVYSCKANAEIKSTCMFRAREDPCDNFRFRRHWYWIKTELTKPWPANARCAKDPDADLPNPVDSEVYKRAADGRSVLHCWYIRLGKGWGRNSA